MPRALRVEYPGAIYDVMIHRDLGVPFFSDDADHQRCVQPRAEPCDDVDKMPDYENVLTD